MEPSKHSNDSETSFKQPLLVGKIGGFPRRIKQVQNTIENPTTSVSEEEDVVDEFKNSPQPDIFSARKLSEDVKILAYEEPSWSALPKVSQTEYVLEVLKNGLIIETINLMKKPFWVFGRLINCDICMQHPTISRHHAVLQYRKENETNNTGFYIYDLESTHGTFLNKNRIKSRNYVRMHVGHMLKLGCSTRTYILNGPSEDTEEESALSVTELKEKRQEELRQREKQRLKEEEIRKKKEERGIDWGLGEDADEETDLSENPYAETNNEDLYIDNPKKALRGFFEREGLELEYDCSEQGMGQFLCKVELPVDDDTGRPIFAEVFHKGKKKEAVIQCALEACRILDRHGVLRQATHESRKRKPKNWEENDYYDSDDDIFLDRTGAIEKKRQMRMKAKVPQKPETYQSLLEKEQKINKFIKDLEAELVDAQKKITAHETSSSLETDSLDSFMMELKQSKPNKQTINKLKSELLKLKQEHGNIIKLVNIAKPASLPPLVADYITIPTTSTSDMKLLPVIGKRKKIKLQLSARSTNLQTFDTENVDTKDVDNMDPEEEYDASQKEDWQNECAAMSTSGLVGQVMNSTNNMNEEAILPSIPRESEESDKSNYITISKDDQKLAMEKFEIFLKEQVDCNQDTLGEILYNLKTLLNDVNCSPEELKLLDTKQFQITKLFNDKKKSKHDEKFDCKISLELGKILNELQMITQQKSNVKSGFSNVSVKHMIKYDEENTQKRPNPNSDVKKEASEEIDEKKKRRNQRRIQQKQERAEIERQKGYDEDVNRDDYNMWIPPCNQSGDGRTELNDKYGY